MNEDQSPTIVYDDEQIRVIWSPNNSDFLVVTFGDLINQALGVGFFADIPLKKLGISAIGFMSKSENWYPNDSMQKAFRAVDAIIARYGIRIIYGGSMGGYGAIKYSRLLGATRVIALCPQWSIDASECEDQNPGWTEYYHPSMKGMGIRSWDVAGNIFVFADQHNKTDMFHCNKIVENCKYAKFINVPMADHYITTIFSGTSNLRMILEAGIKNDVAALRQFSRRTRKGHILWRQQWLRHVMRRFPKIGMKFLLSEDNVINIHNNWLYLNEILTHLVNEAGHEKAEAVYREFRPLIPTLSEQYLITKYFAGLLGRRTYLRTVHGSKVVYDLSRNKIFHTKSPLRAWDVPIEVEFIGATASLYAVVDGVRFQMSVTADQSVGVADCVARGTAPFALAKIANSDHFTINYKGLFLSSEYFHNIFCNRKDADEWEKFSLDM